MSKITQALEKAARERLQRSQEQVTVPAAAPVVIPVSPAVPPRTAQQPIRRLESVHIDPHIVSATDSTSPIAEQYRIMRTNLQSLPLRSGPKAIVVTSAVNGEGKSVTSLNLALTLARQETLRVALIDADMRKSSVPKWLGLPPDTKGLSTILGTTGELNGELVSLQTPRLAILPAGPVPDHPAELLQSVNMKRLLASLKSRFDMIIIDAPPVLPVADPGVIASQTDGVLLVVRAGRTQRRTVREAHELLKKMRANVLGCVLTHVEYYLPGYHRYYHYYRYASKTDGSKAGGTAAPPPSA
jgi:capsular exopolysaccharide synthesis family protein